MFFVTSTFFRWIFSNFAEDYVVRVVVRKVLYIRQFFRELKRRFSRKTISSYCTTTVRVWENNSFDDKKQQTLYLALQHLHVVHVVHALRTYVVYCTAALKINTKVQIVQYCTRYTVLSKVLSFRTILFMMLKISCHMHT